MVASARAPIMVFRLRQVAHISLLVGVVALLCLLPALWWLFEGKTEYIAMIHAFAFGKRHLLPALLVAGTVLILTAAISTWGIALYSTFRVAGPLYRFSLNLERQIVEGPLPVEKIRDHDLLLEEYKLLAHSAESLQAYYDAMSELVDLATAQLQLPDPNLNDGLSRTLQRLKELERLARL